MIGPGAEKGWRERAVRREWRGQGWRQALGLEDGTAFMMTAVAVSLGAAVGIQESIGQGMC